MGKAIEGMSRGIPRRKMVTFVVNVHEYALLVSLAQAENRSVSETLREMVREAAERRGLAQPEPGGQG